MLYIPLYLFLIPSPFSSFGKYEERIPRNYINFTLQIFPFKISVEKSSTKLNKIIHWIIHCGIVELNSQRKFQKDIFTWLHIQNESIILTTPSLINLSFSNLSYNFHASPKVSKKSRVQRTMYYLNKHSCQNVSMGIFFLFHTYPHHSFF